MYFSQREFMWYFPLKPAVSKQRGDVGLFCVLSRKILLEISNIKLKILNIFQEIENILQEIYKIPLEF